MACVEMSQKPVGCTRIWVAGLPKAGGASCWAEGGVLKIQGDVV